MTRKLVLLSAFQLVGFSLFAQQETTTRSVGKTPVKLQPATTNTTLDPVNSNDSLAGRTVEYCDYMIAAIDSKVAHVKGDQAENEKALASGWYDRMAKNRAAWVADRDELVRRQTATK